MGQTPRDGKCDQWQLEMFRKAEIICLKGSLLGKFSVSTIKSKYKANQILCLFFL